MSLEFSGVYQSLSYVWKFESIVFFVMYYFVMIHFIKSVYPNTNNVFWKYFVKNHIFPDVLTTIQLIVVVNIFGCINYYGTEVKTFRVLLDVKLLPGSKGDNSIPLMKMIFSVVSYQLCMLLQILICVSNQKLLCHFSLVFLKYYFLNQLCVC